MHRLRVRKPSPSMAVAIAALFVALGGTAVAAKFGPFKGDKIIKKHSLSGNRLRNGTITSSQIKLSSLGKVPSAANADTAGHATNADHAVNADQLGGVAASGYQGKSQWALVQSNGTIGIQSGGITATNTSAGFYFLNFGRSVEGRPIMVTNWNSVGGAPSTAVCGTGGTSAGDASCTGSGIPNDGNHVFVETNNASGVLANHEFYILVEAP